MKTNADSLTAIPEPLFSQLRSLAPSVAFSVYREIDGSFKWDGDGPNPVKDGFDPYTVAVCASAIVGGKKIVEEVFLGGCYFRPDEPTGDLNGYLLQQLQSAAEQLGEAITAEEENESHPAFAEVNSVSSFLQREMQREWEEQQAAKRQSGIVGEKT